jgi:flagellar motility protein MotE (MotC chaperone)
VKLDHDIELNIQGIDSITKAQNKYKLGKGFEFQRNLKNIKNSLERIIKFQKPNYTPEILISIPENEAKAILMAIPKNASITIRI